jgi:DNA-binding Lrp family transcriptional regulator
MARAHVLVNAEIGSEGEVLKEIRKIPNVLESYIIYGVYDIVAIVERKTMSELKETITYKIRGLPKVRSTLTMIDGEGYFRDENGKIVEGYRSEEDIRKKTIQSTL